MPSQPSWAGRDKIGVGVKWPLQEVRVNVTLPGYLPALQRCEQLILQRTGVRALNFNPLKVQVEVRPNSKTIGKQFGPKTQAVLAYIQNNTASLVEWVEKGAATPIQFAPDASKPTDLLTVTSEHVIVRRAPPENFVESSGQFLQVFLNTVRTPELDQEGYLREVTRRVQMLRKKLSLKRKDRVELYLAIDRTKCGLVYDAVFNGRNFLADRAGVSKLNIVSSSAEFVGVPAENRAVEKVKQFEVELGILPQSN